MSLTRSARPRAFGARTGGSALPALMLGLILLAVHARLIALGPLLERDDRHVLAHLHGIRELMVSVASGRFEHLVVYAPLRDLTLYADVALSGWLGWSTFHATNLLLTGGLVGAVAWLLRARLARGWWAATAIVALHPLLVGSTAWVSARKHILAAGLVIVAMGVVVRHGPEFRDDGGRAASGWSATKLAAVVTALYVASLTAHPIQLLWPLAAIVMAWALRLPRRRAAIMLGPSVALLVGAAAINWRYYAGGLYQQHVAAAKIMNVPDATPAMGLLALGRYVANALAPVRLATTYDPGSPLGMLGLCGGALLFMVAVRRLPARASLPWIAWFFCSLAPVTAVLTQVFVSDTYAIVALVTLVALCAELLARARWPRPGIPALVAPAALGLVLSWLTWGSWRQARAWESDLSLWLAAVDAEPTPRALSQASKHLIAADRPREAAELALRLGRWDPGDPSWAYLYARAVSLQAGLSIPERLELLRARPERSPWLDYHAATLEAEAGQFAAADRTMREALRDPAFFGPESLPTIRAEARAICERARGEACATLDKP